MNTTAVSAATMPEQGAEPVKLLKRIGSTTYTVNVHFSETCTESIDDKLLRLIMREVDEIA